MSEEAKNELVESLKEMNLDHKINSVEEALAFICEYKGLLTKTLKVVKLFTGEKTDQAIDKFIEAVDMICEPEKP